MAKATARCTCKKCGKIFTKTAIRHTREQADSWETWAANNFDICPECEAKERANTAEELAKQAASDGLPKLLGTVNQCIWAEQLRGELIDKMSKATVEAEKKLLTKDGEDAAKYKANMLDVSAAWEWILKNRKNAAWWIENRDTPINQVIACARTEMVINEDADPNVEVSKITTDTTVYPTNQTEGCVEVKVSDAEVTVKYPRDEKFREVVKAAGFIWDHDKRIWGRSISQFTGTSLDRAADICNRLLREGFAVRCDNHQVREMAIDGSFELECKRWVKVLTSGDYEGWLSIKIPTGAEDLYQAARIIKGSRWYKGSVIVPVVYYEIVLDFANIYGYKISAGAASAIKAYSAARSGAVKPVAQEEPMLPDKLMEILDSDCSVLDDLRDD